MTADRKPMTLPRLAQMHASGEKIAMLTCYDAAFASLLDEAGVDMLLIGDSLGNVLQGRGHGAGQPGRHALPHDLRAPRREVRLRRGGPALRQLPRVQEEAWKSAAALVKAGAHMVKLEGGGWTAETVRFLSERGIPVCAHLGFTPQTVTSLGGFKVQGRDEAGAARIKRRSRRRGGRRGHAAVRDGAGRAGRRDHGASPGARHRHRRGRGCSGQVLVLHDMLGVTPGRKPRFVKDFMAGKDSVWPA
jgi:3-methyl-2-oxobutanoate hydroxymethyltransferase